MNTGLKISHNNVLTYSANLRSYGCRKNPTIAPANPGSDRNNTDKMKINELIRNVAKLVESRETIDHGSIRCLHSDNAVREIESAEGCDSVGTGTVGDDDLAADLMEIAEDGDRIAEIHFDDLVKLEYAYRSEDITDYLTADKEDELILLDKLIDAAREIV
jgi:hypothetical protein